MTHSTVNFVAVTLFKSNPPTVVTFENCIDHRTSRCQIKTIKAAPYWDREVSIPATNMEAGTKELIQKIFALV